MLVDMVLLWRGTAAIGTHESVDLHFGEGHFLAFQDVEGVASAVRTVGHQALHFTLLVTLLTTAEGGDANYFEDGSIGQSTLATGFKSELHGFRDDPGEGADFHGEACNDVGVLAPCMLLGEFDETLGQA